jgi:2-haloacid dehalogenase
MAVRPAPLALVFDVFGTVVDWRGSVIDEVDALNRRLGLTLDAAGLADAWRAGYQPAMHAVRQGQRPWVDLDTLHRGILDRLLAERGVDLPEDERDALNRCWHRLRPWPDVVAGLARLKQRHVIASLSNGHVALLVGLAKAGGLPWDTVLSAELFGHYKPDREVYLGAAHLLRVPPGRLMMVAAHASDLRGAAACGLMTAHVHRPLELGPGVSAEPWTPGEFHLEVGDFAELATALGC